MLQLPERPFKRIALLLLAVSFVFVGVTHFVWPAWFVRIMPPQLPAHLELVYLSGAFEIAGGIGVLLPRVRALAGWGLVLLLIAVYPANIYMALHPELFPDVPPAVSYGRLPFQFLFIAWARWATRSDRSPAQTTSASAS